MLNMLLFLGAFLITAALEEKKTHACNYTEAWTRTHTLPRTHTHTHTYNY